jgi:hypothetical protein
MWRLRSAKALTNADERIISRSESPTPSVSKPVTFDVESLMHTYCKSRTIGVGGFALRGTLPSTPSSHYKETHV